MPLNPDVNTLQQGPYDPYDPDLIPVCVIVDKVYFQCQQRECIEDVRVKLPHDCGSEFEFLDIVFNPGKIIDGTLIITDIPNRPNFRRVRFKIKVTFNVRIRNTTTGAIQNITGALPPIQKDVVLYIPDARDEFTFKIVVETLSQSLTEPIFDDNCLIFTIGVFILIKVVGKVQLLIPEFGFCPAPPECEDFQPDDVCDEFDGADFPDFFPPQLDDMDLE